MADVTKSIGTTSRDYSTITAWEADLDNGGVYSSGDVAIGECYNDSAFDEGAKVTINGGTTVGLTKVTLTVASGERHDGTAGTGARWANTSTTTMSPMIAISALAGSSLQWLELDGGNVASNGPRGWATFSERNTFGAYLLCHGINSNQSIALSGLAGHYGTTGSPFAYWMNCIVYDFANASTTYGCIGIDNRGRGTHNYNCTVYDVTAPNAPDTPTDTDGPRGINYTNASGVDWRNNISVSAGRCFYQTSAPTGGTLSHNLSSDTTAPGTSSLTSKTAANQFVSTTGGSEDLHLKSGADAARAGTDLGTTPTGVNIDIDGEDRDATGVTWDIGADQSPLAVRTAKGTFETKSYSDPTTAISSLTLAADSVLIVSVSGTGTLASITATWNSNSMTARTNYGANTAYQRTFYYYSSGGGTGNLSIGGTGPSYITVTATQWEGLTSTPFDKEAGSSGSGTTRSSGATATTSQADEVLIGFSTHEEDDTPAHGTNTGNASTDGQTATTSGGGGPTTEQSQLESYAIVSATGTYTHSRTGADNDNWAASISTWKINTLTAYTLACDVGSYSVSGVAATLQHDHTLTTNVGSYAVNGVAATFSKGRTLAADVGSVAVTGVAANLLKGYKLTCDPGSYAVNGVNAITAYGRLFAADPGSYTVSGLDTTLSRDWVLLTNVGSYSVAGVDATFRRGYRVPTDVGSYSVAGLDANLNKGKLLVVDAGSYAVSGVDANLKYGRVFLCEPGSYTVAGVNAALQYGRKFPADVGSYTVTGVAATPTVGRAIAAATGSYAVTGSAANVLYGRQFPTDVGAYTVSGLDATLTKSGSFTITADPGSYAVTGSTAALTKPDTATIITLFGSERRTASAISPEFRTTGRGIRLMWDITAFVSGSWTFKIQVMSPAGDWMDLDGASTAAQVGTGEGTLTIFPGAAETANVSVSDVITSPWRIYALAGGSSDATFAIYALEIP